MYFKILKMKYYKVLKKKYYDRSIKKSQAFFFSFIFILLNSK